MSTGDQVAGREFAPHQEQHQVPANPYGSPYAEAPDLAYPPFTVAPQPLPAQAVPPIPATAPSWPTQDAVSELGPLRPEKPPTLTATLLAKAPHFLGSLLVVMAVVLLMPWWAKTLVVLAWLASGALVFHRGTERMLAGVLFGFRQLTPAERQRVQPTWNEVTSRFGVAPDEYELWIQESEELSAFAAAGHIVAVTTRSLKSLPDGELAGVIAHEMGHHQAGHAWVALIGEWYAAPGRVAWWVFKKVSWLAVRLAAERSLMWAAVFGLTALAVAVSVVAAVPPLLLVFVTPYLSAWLSRRAELHADRLAAQRGYGAALIGAFERIKNDEIVLLERLARDGKIKRDAMGHPLRPHQGWSLRMLASHPELDERITALRGYLATGLSEG
ncbi:M48 family metalloprotease [Streptomyces sp. NPDC127066]|uniref:M48 family metalloprotease n=1 Tax=Streptomyces sp. NPDC127066 TaxID=3347125 RepID=UPI003668D7CA